MSKRVIMEIASNKQIAKDVYQMILKGDIVGCIQNPGIAVMLKSSTIIMFTMGRIRSGVED